MLDTARPIRLERLAHAVLSFVELNYETLPAESSFFDAAWDAPRREAVASFRRYLDDAEENDANEAQRALRWVLNVAPDRFGAVIRTLRIPYPRHDADELRRFLELLWTESFQGAWRIDDFDPDAYCVVPD